ncbi:Release factor glutamine methyltransferase [Propionispora sp. 2/2-37]|uniref:peptide chain release factor N(5)-glutamine methyltransferase n=1 Tax=Propionispora sp. 2/2-37 TaxID=1677858 RepID=UPI0006BB650C|nr:peptide chain release factor N(5)-glutamine methyltransferase [Propionispora sp. 2/2-37]CUH95477.1 Release factor glutamine methyltransferase [Propionispora sp. 2/2-37]
MDKKCVWTIGTLLTWTKQYFGEKGVDNPRLDAEVLLSHILGKDRLYLYVHFDQPLEQAELAAFRETVKRRARREPVAYITGSKEFMGLSFAVNRSVLIPRPDTEILVEAVLKRLQGRGNPSILDLGTGSGAIIVSLLSKVPLAAGVAVDISDQALTVAKQNAVTHQVMERLELKRGDLFELLEKSVFDVIVSNPPYILDEDLVRLEPEVKYEPHGALSGGPDGLIFYRRIIGGMALHLKPEGFGALEVGEGQAAAVAQMAAANSMVVEEIIKDYAGIDRVVMLRRI